MAFLLICPRWTGAPFVFFPPLYCAPALEAFEAVEIVLGETTERSWVRGDDGGASDLRYAGYAEVMDRGRVGEESAWCCGAECGVAGRGAERRPARVVRAEQVRRRGHASERRTIRQAWVEGEALAGDAQAAARVVVRAAA